MKKRLVVYNSLPEPLLAELRELMKPSAIFINASRGAIVGEAALIEALRKGTIRAAALDVFEQEPLRAGSPLLKMNNVVALPHIGSATHETRYTMARARWKTSLRPSQESRRALPIPRCSIEA